MSDDIDIAQIREWLKKEPASMFVENRRVIDAMPKVLDALEQARKERDDWQRTSESWRLAHFAWQQWGEKMRQLVGGTLNGDEPTRNAIEERALKWRDGRDAAQLRAVRAENERDALRTQLAHLAESAGDDSCADFARKLNAERDALRARLAEAERGRDEARANAVLEAQHHHHLRAERDSLRAEVDRLRALLGEACELAAQYIDGAPGPRVGASQHLARIRAEATSKEGR